jgi:MFS family permease
VASYLCFAAVLFVILPERMRRAPRPAAAPEGSRGPAQGYRTVLGDRALLGAFVVNTLLVTCAFSQVMSAFPAWVTGPAHSTSHVVGIAFAVNTALIVVLQLFVLRAVTGRRRSRTAAAASLVFAASWIVVLAAAYTRGALVAAALVGGLAIFAFGEMLLSPTLQALVNDLAPDTLRGRYNALFGLSWQIGPVVGPTAAGFALGYGLGKELFLVLAGGCVAAALLALRLERAVPEEADFGFGLPRQPRGATQPAAAVPAGDAGALLPSNKAFHQGGGVR